MDFNTQLLTKFLKLPQKKEPQITNNINLKQLEADGNPYENIILK
jgi:hypothetical protein